MKKICKVLFLMSFFGIFYFFEQHGMEAESMALYDQTSETSQQAKLFAEIIKIQTDVSKKEMI